MVTPPTQHAFLVRHLRDSDPWVIGRAGMHYRDLLPGRLGGSIIASHIRIPEGGPVPDMVHYHTVGFQLIFCYRGWVRLVYEDQGEPFILEAGDCVIQPPEIRHRVLESGDGLEVIEIGVPAEHITTIDHEMELPNAHRRSRPRVPGPALRPPRSREGDAAAVPHPGFLDARYRHRRGDTKGVAGVQVARPEAGWRPDVTSHDTDILFDFVMSGHMTLAGEGQEQQRAEAGRCLRRAAGHEDRLSRLHRRSRAARGVSARDVHDDAPRRHGGRAAGGSRHGRGTANQARARIFGTAALPADGARGRRPAEKRARFRRGNCSRRAWPASPRSRPPSTPPSPSARERARDVTGRPAGPRGRTRSRSAAGWPGCRSRSRT